MATAVCPRCQRPNPRLLDASSHLAHANYYHCERCGLVWNQPKTGDGPIHIVTPPAADPPED